ncbi:type III polyketide synthase [Azospirillum sp. 412522]|nr:type III polyketide synthase [Azospirillum sp. 412522]MBY6263209.1 type III polyketide synthase [Azospirillum sp. 412522]
MFPPVALLGLGLGLPPHVLSQEEAALLTARIFGDRLAGFPQFERVFANTGIARRHCARPADWYAAPHGWSDRMAAYRQAASALFVQAATAALADADVDPAAIDCVVVSSSSGFAVPSLEGQLAEAMGFRPDVERVPLFGLGCAGGVAGLATAARLAATPGRTVLFVTIELCSLAFRQDDGSRANLVATALFGDGAAACVLRGGADERAFAVIHGAGQHLFPRSQEIMGWRIDDGGFGIVLSAALPQFLQSHLRPALARLLAQCGTDEERIGRLLCHPGGTRVLAALEEVLRLETGSLDHERAVLADHGNMSAPTVLFVLDRARRAGLPDRAALLALGPGFAANLITMRRGPR